MSRRIAFALAQSLLLALVFSGCIYSRRDPWGYERWWEHRYQDEFIRRFRPPPVIRAPDLRPRSGDTFSQGEGVGIEVKVENEGDSVAEPFDVTAVVTVPGRPPESFSIRFPDLDPGETFETYIGTVSLAGVARPVDIEVLVTADPATAALPRGEVIEFDEADNTRTFPYRIF